MVLKPPLSSSSASRKSALSCSPYLGIEKCRGWPQGSEYMQSFRKKMPISLSPSLASSSSRNQSVAESRRKNAISAAQPEQRDYRRLGSTPISERKTHRDLACVRIF